MGETELTYWGSRCGSVHVVLAVQVRAEGLAIDSACVCWVYGCALLTPLPVH